MRHPLWLRSIRQVPSPLLTCLFGRTVCFFPRHRLSNAPVVKSYAAPACVHNPCDTVKPGRNDVPDEEEVKRLEELRVAWAENTTLQVRCADFTSRIYSGDIAEEGYTVVLSDPQPQVRVCERRCCPGKEVEDEGNTHWQSD